MVHRVPGCLDHLAPLKLREPGGGIKMSGTRILAEPRLHLVGYGPSASTVGANRAGRAAAQEIRRLLGSPLDAASAAWDHRPLSPILPGTGR